MQGQQVICQANFGVPSNAQFPSADENGTTLTLIADKAVYNQTKDSLPCWAGIVPDSRDQ